MATVSSLSFALNSQHFFSTQKLDNIGAGFKSTAEVAGLSSNPSMTDATHAKNENFYLSIVSSTSHTTKALTSEEQQILTELKKRDREVRQHEETHLRHAGRFARGGARYEYEVGPDGKRYAVAGKVFIDLSKIPGDPEATIEKARQIQRAALAPKEPSPEDRAVAVEARKMELQAREEKKKMKKAEEEKKIYNQKGEKSIMASMWGRLNLLA